MDDAEISRMLNFDPLDTAERLLGVKGEASMMMGMALAVGHNLCKGKILEELGDTAFTNRLVRYLSIAGDLGFERVLDLPFTGRSWDGEPAPEERFIVLARRDGLVLALDTFRTHDVNAARLWYNWRPSEGTPSEICWRVTSSGGWHRGAGGDGPMVWAGDHDAREALRHKIRQLENHGEFLARWQHQPFLWFLHHMDTKEPGYDHDAINAARISQLPGWVRLMITAEET
jgi:hypothetical protein